MVTFTINKPQMLAYIPYMDPMGIANNCSMLVDVILEGTRIGDMSALEALDANVKEVRDFFDNREVRRLGRGICKICVSYSG